MGSSRKFGGQGTSLRRTGDSSSMASRYVSSEYTMDDSLHSDTTSRSSRARSSEASILGYGNQESFPRNTPCCVYSEALIRSSQRLRARSMSPYKSNLDFYRGKTKSIYEKEPLFVDFVRNNRPNHYDNENLTKLKKSFHSKLLEEHLGNTSAIADPYTPSAIDLKYLWKMSNDQDSRSEALAKKYRKPVPEPSRLPLIYVYHRNT